MDRGNAQQAFRRLTDDFLPAPKIGQHSVEILRQAGYAEAEIESLIAARTVIGGRIAGNPQSVREDSR